MGSSVQLPTRALQASYTGVLEDLFWRVRIFTNYMYMLYSFEMQVIRDEVSTSGRIGPKDLALGFTPQWPPFGSARLKLERFRVNQHI